MSEASVDPLPQRVLLTGGSRGIGRAIAQALIEAGVRLALVGRDLPALEALARRADGHALLALDLERSEEAETCVERAADALGGLDGFVSAAGVVEHAPIGGIGRESLQRQLAVNFVAPCLIAQRAAAHIAAAGGGAMLLVASTLGLKPEAPLGAAYAASKAALISFARSLALELGPRGVRVNALAPGVVDTDMTRTLRGAAAQPPPTSDERQARVRAQLEALRRLHPLGRLGRPQDVAETAMYLLRAPYVTGAVVNVDGGLLLGHPRA